MLSSSLPGRACADELSPSIVEPSRRWEQDGEVSWRLSYSSVRTASNFDANASRRSREEQLSGTVVHALSNTLSIGFGASIFRNRHSNRMSAVFPSRSRSMALDLAGYLQFANGSTLRAGWYQSGGWGAHDLQRDVIKMNNGDRPARAGAQVALQLPVMVETSRLLKSSRIAIEASDGRASAPGLGWRHANTVTLRLATAF